MINYRMIERIAVVVIIILTSAAGQAKDQMNSSGTGPMAEPAGKPEFGAPSPAVPLQDAERKQWARDIATFKFDELKDRQILYFYPLTQELADKVLNAAKNAVPNSAQSGAQLAAIGVQYGTQGVDAKTATTSPELYSLAAVPVKWNETSYKFIKDMHDPATFARLVEKYATAFPKATYDNFGAVEKWSALAKGFNAGLAKNAKELVNLKAKSTGPYLWFNLTPITSFIALDRKLNIKGVEPKAVLTSRAAWLAIAK